MSGGLVLLRDASSPASRHSKCSLGSSSLSSCRLNDVTAFHVSPVGSAQAGDVSQAPQMRVKQGVISLISVAQPEWRVALLSCFCGGLRDIS